MVFKHFNNLGQNIDQIGVVGMFLACCLAIRYGEKITKTCEKKCPCLTVTSMEELEVTSDTIF